MDLNKELKQIEKVGQIANNLVTEGNFRAARTVLKKIKNSHCISESCRVSTIIEARIMQSCGNQIAAKTKVLDNLGYVWGILDGFEIIAASNPKTDSASFHYYIEVLGGLATLGYFIQFTELHIASFDVVANSIDEALGYIDEVSNFLDPTAKLVLTSGKNPLETGSYVHRGVVRAYPFRLYEEN